MKEGDHRRETSAPPVEGRREQEAVLGVLGGAVYKENVCSGADPVISLVLQVLPTIFLTRNTTLFLYMLRLHQGYLFMHHDGAAVASILWSMLITTHLRLSILLQCVLAQQFIVL